MNKYNKPLVAEAGGIAPSLIICFCLLLLVFVKTFIVKEPASIIEILAIVTTIVAATFIGFVDDILGWLKGLGHASKILMTVPVVLPLVVINAGQRLMNIPLIGNVNFGIFYPLLIVPLAIVGCTNAFNMVAGYNGLESIMGSIILSSLGVVAYLNGLNTVAFICFITVSALIGFLVFNRFPSEIFPGDALTYPVGAIIAGVAILGNMEKFAVCMMLIYFVDLILYVKARLIDKVGYVNAFGIPDENNVLAQPYPKVYDSTHIVIKLLKKLKIKSTEPRVVGVMALAQIIISVVVVVVMI